MANGTWSEPPNQLNNALAPLNLDNLRKGDSPPPLDIVDSAFALPLSK